jgi:nitroreductase/NAD-dependent dihydropyrimidine dehydrogenase PreA subunit
MTIFEINRQTCTQCGICAAECPGFVIDFKAGSFPHPTAQAEVGCISCGHCVAVCPNGSLSHRVSPLLKSPQIREDLKISPEQCQQLLRSRRSVRVFKNTPVPRETIGRLIEDARYAPTAHNGEEVEWLVIDTPKELARVEELGAEWIKWTIKNQPEMAASFNMPDMLKRQEVNNNTFLRGAPVLVIAHTSSDTSVQTIATLDSATALGYLDLAANSFGLGTCWAGLVFIMAGSFPPFKAALTLPDGHAVYGCMMLGYNRYKHQRIPVRKDPPITWR